MKSTFLIVLLSLMVGVDAAERDPSMAVAISSSGLGFFGKMATKIIKEELPKVTIPPVTVPVSSGPGSGTLDLSELNIVDFEVPSIQLKTTLPFVETSSDGGRIELGGSWQAKYECLTTWHVHGTLDVTVTDLNSELLFNVFGEGGHPQVKIQSCKVNVQDVNISINGGGLLGWIVSTLYGEKINEAVMEAINTQVCSNLQTTFVERLNRALLLNQKHIDFGHGIRVDYELVSEPIQATETHILAQSYVDVVLDNQGCQLPTNPLQINQLNDAFMSNIWIGETIPNCLLESAHKSKYLRFVLTHDVYAELDTFLATNCSLFQPCIGRFFPQLAKRYPNRHIQMMFYSASAPSVNLSAENGVKIESNFFVDWQIQPEQGKPNVNGTLAQIEMEFRADVEPVILRQHLSGNITSTYVEFTEVYSNIGKFSNFFLNTMDMFLNPVIRLEADKLLQKGIPVPMIEGVELADDTLLSVEDGAIRCNANFSYVN